MNARDPLDPAALVEEMQRVGAAAAARIADEFSRALDRRTVDGTGHDRSAGSDPGDDTEVVGVPTDDLRDALRAARTNAARAMDAAVGALGRAFDGYAQVLDAVVTQRAGDADGGIVVVDVASGRGHASLWLHHTSGEPGAELELRAGPLVRDDGDLLTGTVRLVPNRVGPLAPGASVEVRVEVEVHPCHDRGRYHGLVVAAPGDLTLRIVVDLDGPAGGGAGARR